MVSISVRHLFHKPMDEKIKTWTLRFPAKEDPNIEKALFDWPIVLQYDVKAKDPLISRKFSGMKFFYAGVRLTNQKPHTFVCPFDKPINSLYFRSFVVSVLFARFHFTVVRKLLYRTREFFLLMLCSRTSLGYSGNNFQKVLEKKMLESYLYCH